MVGYFTHFTQYAQVVTNDKQNIHTGHSINYQLQTKSCMWILLFCVITSQSECSLCHNHKLLLKYWYIIMSRVQLEILQDFYSETASALETPHVDVFLKLQ